jgi:phage recombination protein Bet
VAQKPLDDKPVKFDVAGRNVELSVALTQAYFCPKASPAEAYIFNQWCSHVGLDPWRRECYLVKFGDDPATQLVAADVYKKRAERNPRYQGKKDGVIVLDKDGNLVDRVGAFVLDTDTIVGGWCKVFVKDYVEPVEARVSFKEYCKMKDGKPAAQWRDRPATMINKVAMVHALRNAFPNDLGSMYVAEEMGMEEPASNSEISQPKNVQDADYVSVDESTGEVVDQESFAESFFDQEG